MEGARGITYRMSECDGGREVTGRKTRVTQKMGGCLGEGCIRVCTLFKSVV